MRRHESRAMSVIRKRVRQINLNDSTKTIKYNFHQSLNMIRGRLKLGENLTLLQKLNFATRHVPYIMESDDFSDVVANYCYENMSVAIRSETDKLMIELCSKIILNLARYTPTTDHTFKPRFFSTITQMLKRWCDKDCDTFNVLCTLMWVFAHNTKKRRVRNLYIY